MKQQRRTEYISYCFSHSEKIQSHISEIYLNKLLINIYEPDSTKDFHFKRERKKLEDFRV